MENTTKVRSRNFRLVLAAAFSAIIIILTFTNLGFISFSPVVSITILPMFVILTATLAGLPEGIFAGFIMGLMSLIKAAMSPSGILDPLFVNPLCSVLPRMLLGVVAWLVWTVFQKASQFRKETIIGITGIFGGLFYMVLANTVNITNSAAVGVSIAVTGVVWMLLTSLSQISTVVIAAITGFVATFAHTLLVYGCIFLFEGKDMRAALDTLGMTGVGFFGVVGAGIVSEALEAVASTLICAAVYAVIFASTYKKSKLSMEDDE